jgi:hypothetical protein
MFWGLWGECVCNRVLRGLWGECVFVMCLLGGGRHEHRDVGVRVV